MGADTPRPSVALEQHRDTVLRLVHEHRASDPRVVGSVVRGEDLPGSDLDLLVRFAPGASLFDQIGLAQDLEDLLGVHVDVISEGGLTERYEQLRAQARPL